MKTSLLGILFLSLLSLEAFASNVGCTAVSYKGKRIDFWANGELFNPRNGSGVIRIDGREVAHFDGRDLDINLLGKSFKASNDRGDFVSGRILNISTHSSIITELTIPAFNIRYTNIPVRCEVK